MEKTEAQKTLERIRQAKRVMSGVDKDKFDMGSWTGLNECGTTHCVGGWLRCDPWFIENTEIRDVFRYEHGYVFVTEWSSTNMSGIETLLANMMGIRTSEAKTLFGLPLGQLGTPDTIEDVLRYLDELEQRYTRIAEQGNESTEPSVQETEDS
jgi:hypothetical protein